MAYKMKGAPMMANTKSHGTNKNYQKSGMGQASGAPFLGKLAKGAGKLLKGAAKFGAFGPLGMIGSHLMDRNKAKQGGAADANAAAGVGGAGAAQPAAAPVAQAPGAAPVDATQMEEPGMQGAAMGKHLMKGAPMYGKKKGAPKYKSDAQRKAVHASKADGGKGAPFVKKYLKKRKEDIAKGKKTSFVDKAKSLGKAVKDNVLEVDQAINKTRDAYIINKRKARDKKKAEYKSTKK